MKFFCHHRHSGASRNPFHGLRRNGGISFVFFVFLIISTNAHADQNSPPLQMALGKYIASMCTTCHQPDKSFEGIPPILGLGADKMYEMMMEYKDSVEHHEVMENIAKSLSKAEIRALALYIASLKSQGRSM